MAQLSTFADRFRSPGFNTPTYTQHPVSRRGVCKFLTAGRGDAAQTIAMWGSPAAVPDAPTNLIGSFAGSTVSLSWIAPVTGGAPSSYVIEAALTAVSVPAGSVRAMQVA